MAETQKHNYDEKTQRYLSAQFPDTVVVYVEYWATAGNDLAEMAQYWTKQTTDTLKDSAFLIGTGDTKVPLLQYAAGQGDLHAFQFVFPRTMKGHAVVGPQDDSLLVEFVHPNLRQRGEKPVRTEFKLKKMELDGQLVY